MAAPMILQHGGAQIGGHFFSHGVPVSLAMQAYRWMSCQQSSRYHRCLRAGGGTSTEGGVMASFGRGGIVGFRPSKRSRSPVGSTPASQLAGVPHAAVLCKGVPLGQ